MCLIPLRSNATHAPVRIIVEFVGVNGTAYNLPITVDVYLVTDATGDKTGILCSGYSDSSGVFDCDMPATSVPSIVGTSLSATVTLNNMFASIVDWTGQSSDHKVMKTYTAPESTPLLSTNVTVLTVRLSTSPTDQISNSTECSMMCTPYRRDA